jgi:hypothetical protein
MMKLKLYMYVFKKNLHVNSLKETRTELRIEVTNDLSSKTLLISESLDMLASWTDIWRAAMHINNQDTHQNMWSVTEETHF